MKQWIPTLLLVAVCIGGFWYAAANDFFAEPEEELQEKQLVGLTNENLQSISIRSEVNNVRLEHDGGKWTLADKPDVPLNASNVDGWVNALILMVYSDVIEKDAKDLAVYGLDQPLEQYEVRKKDGKSVLVQVGDELPTLGTRYVKLGGSNDVYKVSSAGLAELNKNEFDLIEKSPFTVNYDAISRVQANWKGTSADLLRTVKGADSNGNEWKLDGSKKVIDSEARDVMTQLTLLETSDATRPAAEFDFASPDFAVTLTEEANGQTTDVQYVGVIDTELVWVVKQGNRWAYGINGDSIQSFMETMKAKGE